MQGECGQTFLPARNPLQLRRKAAPNRREQCDEHGKLEQVEVLTNALIHTPCREQNDLQQFPGGRPGPAQNRFDFSAPEERTNGPIWPLGRVVLLSVRACESCCPVKS